MGLTLNPENVVLALLRLDRGSFFVYSVPQQRLRAVNALLQMKLEACCVLTTVSCALHRLTRTVGYLSAGVVTEEWHLRLLPSSTRN